MNKLVIQKWNWLYQRISWDRYKKSKEEKC